MSFLCNKVDIIQRRKFIDFYRFYCERERERRQKRDYKLWRYYTMMIMIMLSKILHKGRIMQGDVGKIINFKNIFLSPRIFN